MNLGDVFRHFSLDSIVLNEAEIKRGSGDPSAPGSMNNQGNFQVVELDEGRAAFLIAITADLLDENGDRIIEVAVSYLLAYALDAGYMPSDEELHFFVTQGVVFQAHPYLREFVASATSRAGLPPAQLPVLIRDDLPDSGE